jgi:Ca2+-binding RTX toxin-like protein
MWLTALLPALNQGTGRPQGRRRRREPHRGAAAPRRLIVPRLEVLEDRSVPSLTVTSNRDDGSTALAVDPDGNPLTTDQRGFARVVDAAVDIGAFEVQDLVIDLNPGENVRLQRDAVPGLLDVVFSNSPRPGFTIDIATVSQITINGSADNEVDLEDVPAGIAVTFVGKSGVQAVDVTPTARDLARIQGPVSVTSGSGPVTLTVNDQAGRVGRNYTLASAGLSWGGPSPLIYDHLGALTLNATGFNDTVTAQSLPANAVTLNGGGGSNTLVGPDSSNTWSLAQPSNHEGTLDSTLAFDNFAQLTGGQGLDRFVVPDGAYFPEILSGGDGLHGGSNNTLDLSAWTGPLSVHIFRSVYGGEVTGVVQAFALCQNVIGGQGNDRFVVDQGYGLTSLDGGPGNNTLDLSPHYLNPQNISILGPNSGLVSGEFAAFSHIQNLLTGSTNDKFAFRGTAYLDGTIDAGGGSNSLNYVQSAASVTVNLQSGAASYVNLQGGTVAQSGGVAHIQSFTGGPGSANTLIGPDTPSTWNLTAANSGTVNAVSFTGFQDLTGSAGADTFVFQQGGSVAGVVDGGGGVNALDYSHYTGDVRVDLALGVASLVHQGAAGGVLHIANVTGSVGNDLLVGDANANVLIGGTGRNLLIGGAGADSLTGGGGENILIAGYTSYDQNLAALNAIFAEWTSADSLDVRMHDIRQGGGLNGNSILNPIATGTHPATVFDDGAADQLFDGAGLSWFFVHRPGDQINNGAGPQVSGDVVSVIP